MSLIRHTDTAEISAAAYSYRYLSAPSFYLPSLRCGIPSVGIQDQSNSGYPTRLARHPFASTLGSSFSTPDAKNSSGSETAPYCSKTLVNSL